MLLQTLPTSARYHALLLHSLPHEDSSGASPSPVLANVRDQLTNKEQKIKNHFHYVENISP